MARTAAKKQPPAKVEEDDDTDGWEDAVVEADGKEAADLRLRDWRDVERFREMKELRNMVDDDYGLEEIFHVPLKPRVEVPPRQPKSAAPARLVPASKAPPPKAPPPKAPAPAKPAPKAKLKAKPKRR